MTNRTPNPFRDPANRGISGAAILGMSLVLSGCGSEEPPPAPVVVAPKAPPPPPPPPPPSVTPVSELVAKFGIDPRVSLPEEQAPDTDAERIAVLRFFDGLAKGDAAQLGSLMSGPDAILLERMDESGAFRDATEGIMAINVQTGPASIGDCALAIIMVDGDFEAQLWTYTVDGDPTTDGARFDSVPAPRDIVDRLSGDNWIAAWIEVMEGEWARALEPDEVVEIASTDLTDEEDSASGPTGNRPAGGGGGQPGRKRPTGPAVDPNPQGPGGPIGR